MVRSLKILFALDTTHIGGANEHGKTDPVYSIDFLGNHLIATSGIDDNQPSKGSVRVRSHC